MGLGFDAACARHQQVIDAARGYALRHPGADEDTVLSRLQAKNPKLAAHKHAAMLVHIGVLASQEPRGDLTD